MANLSSNQKKDLAKRCKEDPVFFVREVLGIEPWGKQIEILEAIRDKSKVAIRSGHGIGKSFCVACAVLWFLFTHKNSKVISTAPTARQVESILWAAIRGLYAGAKVALGGKLLRVSLTLDEEWFALGLSTDDPTRFQGHHAEDILVVFDEAPGVDPTIYDAANGLLTTKGAKQLLIGNPTSPSGPFADAFKSPIWHKIHISCYESPGIKEPEKYPRLTSLKWIEERKAEWGEKSPLFLSRVLGEFPDEGENTLIPLSWCLKAVNNVKIKPRETQQYIGLDVARYGDNKTVGINYAPNKVIKIWTLSQKDLMQVTNTAVREAKEIGPNLMGIGLDDTSLGGGVTDRLRELGYPAMPINFARKPQDARYFPGIRDEAYWTLRELFRAEEISIPDNSDLISQLSSLTYKIDHKGRIHIESKDDMKRRGVKSPDYADALMIAVYAAKRMKGTRMRTTAHKGYAPDDKSYY